MEFLDLSLVPINEKLSLAVAKYGVKATSDTYCLDFYECRPALEPGEVRLYLLCHDTGPWHVTDLNIKRSLVELCITVTRDSLPLVSSNVVRSMYSYSYRESGNIVRNMGEFFWDLKPGSNN